MPSSAHRQTWLPTQLYLHGYRPPLFTSITRIRKTTPYQSKHPSTLASQEYVFFVSMCQNARMLANGDPKVFERKGSYLYLMSGDSTQPNDEVHPALLLRCRCCISVRRSSLRLSLCNHVGLMYGALYYLLLLGVEVFGQVLVQRWLFLL